MAKGATWLYRSLVGLAVLSFVGAIYVVASQAALAVDSGLMAAAAVSVLGLFVAIFSLATRYSDDGWEPPAHGWKSTTAHVDGHVNFEGQTRVNYSFQRASGEEQEISVDATKKIAAQLPEGKNFTVHYDPQNPANHLIEVDEVWRRS